MWDYKHCTSHQFKFSWYVKSAAVLDQTSSANAEGWRVPGYGYGNPAAPNDFSPRHGGGDWFCHGKAALLELRSRHTARGARSRRRLICPSALPCAVLSITWLWNSPDLSPISLPLSLFFFRFSPFFFLFLRSAKPSPGKRWRGSADTSDRWLCTGKVFQQLNDTTQQLAAPTSWGAAGRAVPSVLVTGQESRVGGVLRCHCTEAILRRTETMVSSAPRGLSVPEAQDPRAFTAGVGKKTLKKAKLL